ncbi:TrmH family RNA methyltransferase [Candidatus Daviesbacteria bacterium]|nr:TrmH family RNA methyltransferase [Candidatus Daviesbacteria bacterium]
MKLNAKQLRSYSRLAISHSPKAKSQLPKAKSEIYIVLDNVLDTYNIGSIFRLADAVAAKKVYLCGQSETPPNHRIKKASINTTEVVEWEYCETAFKAVSRVKREAKRVKIIAIEQSPKAVPYNTFEYKLPICLVVGHESNGVSKEVLKISDAIVEIPMFGVNKSLNVMVSLGIVLYEVISKTI